MPERFPVFRTGRGGEFTYHGPGQRVAYVDARPEPPRPRPSPLCGRAGKLDHRHAGAIQRRRRAARGPRRRLGAAAATSRRFADGRPAEDKIAAIGIRVRRWVTFHGISLNVDPDLEHYSGHRALRRLRLRRHQPRRSRHRRFHGRSGYRAEKRVRAPVRPDGDVSLIAPTPAMARSRAARRMPARLVLAATVLASAMAFIDGTRRHHRAARHPGGASGRLPGAAVDRERLHADARRADPGRRRARRPRRAAAHLRHRHRDLRRRVARLRARAERRRS